MIAPRFSALLINWQKQHGRHGLPWQGGSAYQVWLSEIMLQQTQVATVIPYYQRFIAAFPDIKTLAAASQDEVLAHWSGLGYYARGRNLHKAAQLVAAQHQGEFPRQFEQILALPGIGRSTAAAICAQAYKQKYAILDGNVKRLLARYCGIHGETNDKKVEARLWQQAELLLPEQDIAVYTQALMDMGALICTRSKPKCQQCPVQSECVASQTQQVSLLPTPRTRKSVPEKNTTFLLVLHGNEILLEQRPSIGIWGGLWCPPQQDDSQLDMQQWSISNSHSLPVFTHIFTHFKLHITPQVLRLTDKPLLVQQANRRWVRVDEALQLGIPTPVRKVLQDL